MESPSGPAGRATNVVAGWPSGAKHPHVDEGPTPPDSAALSRASTSLASLTSVSSSNATVVRGSLSARGRSGSLSSASRAARGQPVLSFRSKLFPSPPDSNGPTPSPRVSPPRPVSQVPAPPTELDLGSRHPITPTDTVARISEHSLSDNTEIITASFTIRGVTVRASLRGSLAGGQLTDVEAARVQVVGLALPLAPRLHFDTDWADQRHRGSLQQSSTNTIVIEPCAEPSAAASPESDPPKQSWFRKLFNCGRDSVSDNDLTGAEPASLAGPITRALARKSVPSIDTRTASLVDDINSPSLPRSVLRRSSDQSVTSPRVYESSTDASEAVVEAWLLSAQQNKTQNQISSRSRALRESSDNPDSLSVNSSPGVARRNSAAINSSFNRSSTFSEMHSHELQKRTRESRVRFMLHPDHELRQRRWRSVRPARAQDPTMTWHRSTSQRSSYARSTSASVSESSQRISSMSSTPPVVSRTSSGKRLGSPNRTLSYSDDEDEDEPDVSLDSSADSELSDSDLEAIQEEANDSPNQDRNKGSSEIIGRPEQRASQAAGTPHQPSPGTQRHFPRPPSSARDSRSLSASALLTAFRSSSDADVPSHGPSVVEEADADADDTHPRGLGVQSSPLPHYLQDSPSPEIRAVPLTPHAGRSSPGFSFTPSPSTNSRLTPQHATVALERQIPLLCLPPAETATQGDGARSLLDQSPPRLNTSSTAPPVSAISLTATHSASPDRGVALLLSPFSVPSASSAESQQDSSQHDGGHNNDRLPLTSDSSIGTVLSTPSTT